MSALFTQGAILAQGQVLVGLESFNRVFLFVVTLQPHLDCDGSPLMLGEERWHNCDGD